MTSRLDEIETEALTALGAVASTDELEAWRVTFQGRKSALAAAMSTIGKLSPEERAAFGKRSNEVRAALEAAFTARKNALERQELEKVLATSAVDVTLPGRPQPRGRLHPATVTWREIRGIWADMGFQVYDGPDVETDEYSFELLNIPADHPARDMWDTFWTTKPGVLLRPHTSPGQIRMMREVCPAPIRVILPGMCYRYEQTSASKDIQFQQFEGLAIGKHIRLTDLLGTISEFIRRMFGEGSVTRFRGSYFPFTEPSVEVDFSCIFCAGKGCNICKYTGWLEIAGAGMVHPAVLLNGGYDPAIYSGFAFGMGIQRITMLKHRITHIRNFWENDLRFLQQF